MDVRTQIKMNDMMRVILNVKALKFGISSISKYFQKRENPRYCHLFKTSEDPKSFLSIASKLYEISEDQFACNSQTRGT